MMGALYRNAGAPFWSGDRETGRRVNKNEVYEPTADDLARRAHKLRPADDTAPPSRQRRAATPPATPSAGKYAGFSTNFASEAAHELAKELGLGDLAFQGAKGTGKDGAWTVADIRTLVGEPEPEEKPKPAPKPALTAKTEFASEAAHEEARENGLTDVSFRRKHGSGKDGAFTVTDVRKLAQDAKDARG